MFRDSWGRKKYGNTIFWTYAADLFNARKVHISYHHLVRRSCFPRTN